MTDTPTFESWGLVEVMGHTRYAGFVSEQSIGGSSFVRVDVPETSAAKAFTKLLGSGSIFAITPMAEDLAKGLAERIHNKPIGEFDLSDEMREQLNVGRKFIAAHEQQGNPTAGESITAIASDLKSANDSRDTDQDDDDPFDDFFASQDDDSDY